MNIRSVRRWLADQIRQHGKPTRFDIGHYVGSVHTTHNVTTPVLHQLAKDVKKQFPDMTQSQYRNLLDELFRSASFEEKILASMIAGKYRILLSRLSGADIDRWMGNLSGWAEVDAYCDEVDLWMRSIPGREALLARWSTSGLLEKRRASLVVLCSTVRHDPDGKWWTMGTGHIGVLAGEKHVMITKAISWLLRSMLKHHGSRVREYVETHATSLPPHRRTGSHDQNDDRKENAVPQLACGTITL